MWNYDSRMTGDAVDCELFAWRNIGFKRGLFLKDEVHDNGSEDDTGNGYEISLHVKFH